jgi:uncharacterized protein (DUF983 family)
VSGRLGHALKLRCPICGSGEMFSGWFRMNARCRGCGFAFERESGYFLGSIYVNYGAAVLLATVMHLLFEYVWNVPIWPQVAILSVFVAAFGLTFFRWARALGLAFDVTIDPPEPREFADEGGPPRGTS